MASNIEYIGLTRLGEDIVKGLSKVEDPTHVFRTGYEILNLKKWNGTLNGEEVHVRENIQMTRNVGGKLLLFSHLIVRDPEEEYVAAEWTQNPLMDNKDKKHDKNSGHCKFR